MQFVRRFFACNSLLKATYREVFWGNASRVFFFENKKNFRSGSARRDEQRAAAGRINDVVVVGRGVKCEHDVHAAHRQTSRGAENAAGRNLKISFLQL